MSITDSAKQSCLLCGYRNKTFYSLYVFVHLCVEDQFERKDNNPVAPLMNDPLLHY